MKLTIFSSVSKAYIDDAADMIDMAWEDVAELLQDHQNITTKEDGILFNLAQFKQIGDTEALLGRKKIYAEGQWTGEYKYFPNTVRRCRENLVSISGILLDFDKGVTIEQAMTRLDGIEYVLYTTFNHKINDHRFRVVLPFSQELLARDIPAREASIIATFEGVDKASFSASQSFYFHAGNEDAIAFHVGGYVIDPYTAFEVGAVAQTHSVQINEHKSDFEVSQAYRDSVLSSLNSCAGVRYPNGLTLVAISKSIGLSFAEFNTLCQKIAAPDSTLIKVPGSRADLWNSDYYKITADKRDKFIKEHSGILGTGSIKDLFGPSKTIRKMKW